MALLTADLRRERKRCAADMRCRSARRCADGGGVNFRLWGPAARQVRTGPGRRHRRAAASRCPRPAMRRAGGNAGCRKPRPARSTTGASTANCWCPIRPRARIRMASHEPSCVVDPLQFEWDGDWAGRPWSEVVLYELHVGAFTPEGTFEAAAERLEALAGAGHHRDRADAAGRLSRPLRLGLRRRAAVSRRTRPTARPTSSSTSSSRRIGSGLMVFLDVVYNHFGPVRQLPRPLCAAVLLRAPHQPLGRGDQLRRTGQRASCATSSCTTRCTGCVEYRIDGLRLDAVHAIVDSSRPDIVAGNLQRGARGDARAATCTWCWRTRTTATGGLRPSPQPGRYDGQWNDDFHHALHVALTGETARLLPRLRPASR